jgi:hypothetical protein
MTDTTNYSNDSNFGYRPQAYGEPHTTNPARAGESSIAYSQPYFSPTTHTADAAQWPSTVPQPVPFSNPAPAGPITPLAGQSGQQGTSVWIFDAQRQKYYYVDYSCKSHINPISARVLIGCI